MKLDRNAVIEKLGGAEAVVGMTGEAKADALEDELPYQCMASAGNRLPTPRRQRTANGLFRKCRLVRGAHHPA